MDQPIHGLEEVQSLIDEVQQQGMREHSQWNASTFRDVCAAHAQQLWNQIRSQEDAQNCFRGYLTLLKEMLGTGAMSRAQIDHYYLHHEKPACELNFLGWCMLDLIPRDLPKIRSNQRLKILADLWNLGEGILSEPAWVDRYVIANRRSLKNLEQTATFLTTLLDPVLQPAEQASWKGPFHVSQLSTRATQDEFLPGEMHLAAPTVLCAHDRRHPDVHLGIFLKRQGQSQLMGVTPCLGHYDESGDLPEIKVAPEVALIDQQTVNLPFLRVSHQHLIARAGFCVVSAQDSQNLWIVESN